MVLTFLLCYAAWTALALSLDRHHEDALGQALLPPRTRLLHATGGGLLLLSLGVAAATGHGGHTATIAVAAWAVMLTAAALAATACMTWHPRLAVRSAAMALATAPPAALWLG